MVPLGQRRRAGNPAPLLTNSAGETGPKVVEKERCEVIFCALERVVGRPSLRLVVVKDKPV